VRRAGAATAGNRAGCSVHRAFRAARDGLLHRKQLPSQYQGDVFVAMARVRPTHPVQRIRVVRVRSGTVDRSGGTRIS
jgi:hypothetical protein